MNPATRPRASVPAPGGGRSGSFVEGRLCGLGPSQAPAARGVNDCSALTVRGSQWSLPQPLPSCPLRGSHCPRPHDSWLWWASLSICCCCCCCCCVLFTSKGVSGTRSPTDLSSHIALATATSRKLSLSFVAFFQGLGPQCISSLPFPLEPSRSW